MADTATAPADEKPGMEYLPEATRELFAKLISRSVDAEISEMLVDRAHAELAAKYTAANTLFDVRRVVEDVREQATDKDTTVAQVAALTALKRELDASLKAVTDELKPRHEALRDEYGAEGVTSKRDADSGKLVYLSRKVWARAIVEKADACEALKAAGLGDFVAEGFNTSSLSSYFRDQVKEREADGEVVDDLDALLPDQLRGVIALTDDHTVGVRG